MCKSPPPTGDFARNEISFINLGPDEGVLDSGVFASRVGGILDLAETEGGDLMYASRHWSLPAARCLQDAPWEPSREWCLGGRLAPTIAAMDPSC